MLMLLKIFLTKIDIMNGSLYILAILDHKRKLLLLLFGKIHKINKIMITLNISKYQNITFLLVKTNNSQVSMEKLV
jgi:hypothetical protein